MDIKNNEADIQSNSGKPLNAGHRWFLGVYALIAAGSAIFYFLFRYDVLSLGSWSANQVPERLCLAGVTCGILLFISRLVEKIIRKNAHTRADKYNVIRVIRLATIIFLAVIVISFLNANWYTAAVSLGLISLILGFALQTPISSLIGWLYIIIRIPYRVGDRIQISNFTGDVVEINYFDTTLWEFAGDYMSNDLPSGRLIRFPNSMVFQSQVYNYSWHKFPYIWNEIPFHVAYESDLAYVEKRIREIAKDELGEEMEEKVNMLRGFIKETPIDEMEIKEYPFVQFRTNANTWVEVLLVYLVEPKHSGTVRSNLIKKILQELLKEPDKVMFPKSNAR
jgi:small-conductance mechanosensitive channel